MPGTVTGAPRLLLRFEGLFVFCAATAAYERSDAGWWLYAALFLAPDLSMLGYLVGRKTGAWLYNACHWYVPSLACVAWGVLGQAPAAFAFGLIWTAHIGFDRALGYGLKYVDGFGVSHLRSVGDALDGA